MDISNTGPFYQQLSDLELAAVVCLVADQHCIIKTPEHLIDDLQSEIELIVARTFGLPGASIQCTAQTTVEEFSNVILADSSGAADEAESPQSTYRKASTVAFHNRIDAEHTSNSLDSRQIVNVVIARDLDRASHPVQIQALELMRSRRIYTRTAIHTTPKRFLFIALVTSSSFTPSHLTSHLNDHFFISHFHDDADDLLHLSGIQPSDSASISSQASVLRHTPFKTQDEPISTNPAISEATIAYLQKVTSQVRTSAEIRRYTHNIVTFLRLHRAVAGGVSALSSRHFTLLTHILPPLHNLSYTTPSIVALAARKIFPHRIVLTTPVTDRSLQWGSSPDAVARALEGVTAGDVVENVLAAVECPL